MARKDAAHNSPYDRTLVYVEDADTYDLVRLTLNAARHAALHLEWPRSIPRADAGRVAHAFAQDTVRYVREDGDQLIRMPWRTLADGHGDCKSLAVLVASLAKAAGRMVVLRYVVYPGDDHYGHVYAIVDGVPADPELSYGAQVQGAATLDRVV